MMTCLTGWNRSQQSQRESRFLRDGSYRGRICCDGAQSHEPIAFQSLEDLGACIHPCQNYSNSVWSSNSCGTGHSSLAYYKTKAVRMSLFRASGYERPIIQAIDSLLRNRVSEECAPMKLASVLSVLCILGFSSETMAAEGRVVGKNSSEFKRLMKNVPGTRRVWPYREAYVKYDTLSRAGHYFRGRFARTLDAACRGLTGYSYMLDDSHWKTPIQLYDCPDGALALHPVLK